MKVVAAIFQLRRRGGKERDCIEILRALAARGHEVTLLTTDAGDNPELSVDIAWLAIRGSSNHVRAATFAADALAWRRGAACDAFLAFERTPGCDYLYAADLPTPHSAWTSWTPRQRTRMALERETFEAASPPVVFFLTEVQREAFRARYRIDDARSVVLPPVLHEERFAAARRCTDRVQTRRSVGWPLDQTVALSVATQMHLKGVDRSLQAMYGFPSVHFAVVGARRALQDRLRPGRLRAQFLPYAGNVIDLMHAADVLVHPARAEAGGQVILEALLAGTPVIATQACGYAGEIARRGAGVVLPEPFQQDALVSAISMVLADLPSYRAQAAQAARDLLATRGRWLETVVETLEHVPHRG